MKFAYLLLAAVLLIAACTHGPKKNLRDSAADTVKYAYSIDTNYRWALNDDTKNAQVVLKALKAEEQLNTDSLSKYFAANFTIHDASGERKLTVAQLQNTLQQEKAKGKNLKVILEDWQSVINENGNQEWVSAWYTQYTTDASGKTDTTRFNDHVQLQNGRIVKINEYKMK